MRAARGIFPRILEVEALPRVALDLDARDLEVELAGGNRHHAGGRGGGGVWGGERGQVLRGSPPQVWEGHEREPCSLPPTGAGNRAPPPPRAPPRPPARP